MKAKSVIPGVVDTVASACAGPISNNHTCNPPVNRHAGLNTCIVPVVKWVVTRS